METINIKKNTTLEIDIDEISRNEGFDLGCKYGESDKWFTGIGFIFIGFFLAIIAIYNLGRILK